MNKSILTFTFQVLVVFRCGNLVGQNLEVLQKARLVPSHLDSCNLEYASEVSLFYPRKLAVDGDKFYLNAGPKTVAFDGKQYWSKNADGKGALISKMKVSASIQLDIHPLILPYSWFWENISQGKWTDLRSQEMWDSTIKRMTFRESKPILGQDCCIYEIAYSSNNEFSVAIGKDGFPIQVESKKDGKSSKLEVLRVVRHSSGAIIGTEFLRTRPDDTQSSVLVQEKCLRINEKVDPALFSFDPLGVVELIDLDKKPK
jgi:hypothetical protein